MKNKYTHQKSTHTYYPHGRGIANLTWWKQFSSEWGKQNDIETHVAQDYFFTLIDFIKDQLIDGDEIPITGLGVLYTENLENGTRKLKFRPSMKFHKTLKQYPIEDDV